ncbi:MAG: Crp/Fnr family transcriptional regulator [Spirochaetaceae bacterium]|jgi:CRP/FNR family cyclic AMP-dependent transcriptional regulator|nr:Crp/Fnr family transcriptional regulator [Spirochaetaceae bacterium]
MENLERFAKTFNPDEVIFFEHEPGDSFYLIQSGQVKIVRIMGDIEKILDILNPGEFFGEMAILEETARSASAITLDSCSVLEFNRANFSSLIQGNPQIGINLLKLFSRRIFDQKRRFMILTLDDLDGKVADVFVMLSELQPPDEESGIREFKASLDDIGHWAGIPVGQCKDVLDNMVSNQKIVINKDTIKVNNINELIRFVSSKRRSQENNERD